MAAFLIYKGSTWHYLLLYSLYILFLKLKATQKKCSILVEHFFLSFFTSSLPEAQVSPTNTYK